MSLPHYRGAGRLAMLLAAGLLWALSAAGSEPDPIEIKKFSFMPREVWVAVGAQVTWVNRDETIHSIVSDSKLFSSRGLDTGDRFTATFDHAGDFAYVCSLHPYMTGIVHVREPPVKPP